MIRPPNEGIDVWLCVEPVDFRKQITGLAALVQDTLAMDPFSTQFEADPIGWTGIAMMPTLTNGGRFPASRNRRCPSVIIRSVDRSTR